MFSIKITRDKNGNKTIKIIPLNGRSFTIQTNDNLPRCHTLQGYNKDSKELIELSFDEVKNYVNLHGTTKQKAAIL